MWKPLDTIESAKSLEVAERVVGGLDNVIHCAEADPLNWCCHFSDKIVVAWDDDWRIRGVVKVKIIPVVDNDQHGLHIGSSRTLLFVVARNDAI